MSRPAEAVNAPGLDVERVRAEFPILQREVHGKPLVYLDTAASAHRPLAVITASLLSGAFSLWPKSIAVPRAPLRASVLRPRRTTRWPRRGQSF